MCNNTPEKYKQEIKKCYEVEKTEEYSRFLLSPTQANLRKLCWERFKDNNNKNDLEAFKAFFDFEFGLDRKNQLKGQTDKLKTIRSFFIGKTESPADITIELAAVLIDFKFRPYQKFDKMLRNDEIQLDTSQIIVEEHNITEIEEGVKIQYIENETGDVDVYVEELDLHVSFLKKIKNIFSQKLTRKFQITILAVILIFGLIASVIYFAFFKMHCMQWSEDHYEIVDCTPEPGANGNLIIPLDDRLLDFRKVAVCDTTTCFRPDGQAIVWYAKNKDKAEFFNSNGIGRHPETERALRPVTEYIKGKYKIPCDSKQK